jgi:SAM-dependent methyltransferase
MPPDADEQDVPSPIDLREQSDAAEWAATADSKRPWRAGVRTAIADLLRGATLPARRVLELGPGPGWLAEVILRTCPIDHYTLFDFSPPMLDMCRARLGAHLAVDFVLGDFTRPNWTKDVPAPFDAVVAMQAVHEVRHKRHVPSLYRQVRELILPDGLFVVCDHVPPSESARMTALHSTPSEQHAALASAGFERISTNLVLNGLYVCSGTAPSLRR